MCLNKSGNVYEVYNGPGKEPWNHVGKRYSHNNRHMMVSKLMELYNNISDGMSETELYDVTRGCWKRKIASVEKADYALAVVYGIVKEVYQIDEWLPAENEVRETIPYNEAVDAGRIIFKGRVADEEIRKNYLDHSAAGLYKRGEASPVKVIMKLQG